MAHDFKNFPELTNSQMELYYFESPHKQIVGDIRVNVVKVHDGDTITVRWDERDFDFPVRFIDTNAPELSEEGGHEVQQWLEGILLGEEIDIEINSANRVDKWGRLLGRIIHRGIDINEESVRSGRATLFEDRDEGKIPNINIMLKEGGL